MVLEKKSEDNVPRMKLRERSLQNSQYNMYVEVERKGEGHTYRQGYREGDQLEVHH